jgi:hypothetical protein
MPRELKASALMSAFVSGFMMSSEVAAGWSCERSMASVYLFLG